MAGQGKGKRGLPRIVIDGLEYITLTELSRITKRDLSHITRLIRHGRLLRGVKKGKVHYVPYKEALLDLLASQIYNI